MRRNNSHPTSLLLSLFHKLCSGLVGSPANAHRMQAIRAEVMNFLSFLSMVWTLWDESNAGIWGTLLVLTGVLLLILDAYFISCQWTGQMRGSWLPRVLSSLSSTSPQSGGVKALDDLLSDLPQCIWVLSYIVTIKFSVIAAICALHSTFSLVEDLSQDSNNNTGTSPSSSSPDRMDDLELQSSLVD